MKPAKTPSDFVLQPAGITAHTAAGTPFCAAPLTHIEAQYGKEQGIFPKSSEQLVAHRQVLAEQGFGFFLRHVVGQFFVWQPTMPITIIRVVGTVVKPLIFLHQFDGYVRFRVAVEQSQQPCCFLHILCRLEKPRDFDPFGQTGFAHLWLQYD